MENIGKVLKIVRIANNMSQKQASNATNVSTIYISELETGRKTHVSGAYLVKLARGYGLILEQLIKLEEYYTNLLVDDERKYRLTLIKTLEMLESNCKLKMQPISRTQARGLLLMSSSVESANKAIDLYLGPASYKEKIACITGMFDVPEIIDRQPEDTDEMVYYIYLTYIINNY